MKRICIALVMIGQIATGQVVPPIVYDIESDWQQTQELPDQAIVQGAGVSLRYRIKTSGRYLALDGLGARWDGRSSATSTQAVQAVAVVVTNVTPNYFQVTLNSDQTGSAVSDWLYSFIVTAGGVDYPLGVGSLDIAASGWTGAGAVLVTETAAAYTDAAVTTHAATIASAGALGHIRIGAGLTIDVDGIVAADGAAPEWGSITGTQSDVAVSGFTNDAGYITTYLRDIPAAGDRITIAPVTNGTVITHTITATDQTPDLSGYVATNDAAYLAALTNLTAGAGISITGSGRTREIASTITQYTDSDAVAAINADSTYTQTVALAAGAVQTESDPVAMVALSSYLPLAGGTNTGTIYVNHVAETLKSTTSDGSLWLSGGTGGGYPAGGHADLYVQGAGDLTYGASIILKTGTGALSAVRFWDKDSVEGGSFSNGTMRADFFVGDGSRLTDLPISLDDLFDVQAISTAAYTATVSRVAHESEYRMTMTSSNLLTISAATFATNKAHTIGLSIWTGGNVLTADTNVIDATMWEAVNISTNAWDRLIFDKGYGQTVWGVLKGGAL